MQYANSYEFYISEFEQLYPNTTVNKRNKLIFGVLSIITVIVFYFRKSAFEFDFINIVSILIILRYLSCLYIQYSNIQKFKKEAEDFIKIGLFDVCTIEQKKEYNEYIEKMNILCK